MENENLFWDLFDRVTEVDKIRTMLDQLMPKAKEDSSTGIFLLPDGNIRCNSYEEAKAIADFFNTLFNLVDALAIGEDGIIYFD